MVSPAAPALYDCRIDHIRTGPLRHRVRLSTYLWLVDLDRLPRLPALLRPLARFDPRDHFGGTAPTLRAGLDRFLAAQGEQPPGGQVLMLANARVLGYVFNPLTLYWCHDTGGALRCVVAEVHNTYGERHGYLLHTDVHGRADTAKELYVSPFHGVDGRYRMHLPEPGSNSPSPYGSRRTAGARSPRPCAAPGAPPPPANCSRPPHGTRGPPSSSPPPSACTASAYTCADCPSGPDRRTPPRRA